MPRIVGAGIRGLMVQGAVALLSGTAFCQSPATLSAAKLSGSVPSRESSTAVQSFIPRTGRLQLFRPAEQRTGSTESERQSDLETGGLAVSRSRGLFPPSRLLPATAMPYVARYADVAQGLPLVPVTPPRKSKPTSQASSTAKSPASAKKTTPPAAADWPPQSVPTTAGQDDPALKIERLPAVTQTPSRPTLAPGVKLPQQPIEIYPDTGY